MSLNLIKTNKCKGLFFRCRKNSYWNGKKLVFMESLVLLKRKSCNCNTCLFTIEEIKEDCNILIFPKDGIEEGSLYTIQVVNISRNIEHGHVDEYDLKLVKVLDNE